MKLLELEPQFLKVDPTNPDHFQSVDFIGQSNGLMFLCPVCFLKNDGPKGTHSVICWTPEVPQTVNPKPGRWNFEGTGYGDLSLVSGSSSILLDSKPLSEEEKARGYKEPCRAHFFIKNGEIKFA